MNPSIPFPRRTLATVVAVACGSLPAAGQAAANAGKVDYAVGNVTATGIDGQLRNIGKGSKIAIGDTIVTNAGRAWLRFRDGGYMSLQPGTEFRVDDYHFEDKEDGNERSFFSLLKGGVRAITGLVGKTNRQNYRVNTPVATIGIRGTEYLAQLGNSLTLTCGAGVCVVTNALEEIILQAGETVYVEDQNSRGERLTRKVVLLPTEAPEFAVGDFRNDDGSLQLVDPPPDTPVVPPPPDEFSQSVPLVPGEQSGLYLAVSYAGDGGECCGFFTESDAFVATGTAPDHVTAILDNSLGLEQASWNPNLQRNDAVFADTGTDINKTIAWGRWTDGTVLGSIFNFGSLDVSNSNKGVAYVVGTPTPADDLLNLKSQGAVAVYNLIGVTEPVFGDDGFEGNDTFGDFNSATGALAANFANSTVNASLNLEFVNGDLDITSGAMPIAAGRGGVFGGMGNWATSTINVSASYGTKIHGFFAGGAASHAGVAYEVFVTESGGFTVNGTGGFQKAGTASP